MYNLVKAAEDGWSGTVADALNYRVVWQRCPPAARPLSLDRDAWAL